MKQILIFPLLLAALAGTAQAEESMGFTGAEISGHNAKYGVTGMIAPLPGYHIGDGWVVRGLLDGVTYSYEKNSTTIDAEAYGAELALGYQGYYSQGWYAAYAGVFYRNTEFSPDDPNNEIRGGHVDMRFQLEGEHNFTDSFKLNANASYAPDHEAYWFRLRPLYRIGTHVYVGPEGIIQGDKDYDAWQAGLVVTNIKLADNVDLGFKAGARKTEGQSASPYIGVEVGYLFK